MGIVVNKVLHRKEDDFIRFYNKTKLVASISLGIKQIMIQTPDGWVHASEEQKQALREAYKKYVEFV
jgi:hypothetical protein